MSQAWRIMSVMQGKEKKSEEREQENARKQLTFWQTHKRKTNVFTESKKVRGMHSLESVGLRRRECQDT